MSPAHAEAEKSLKSAADKFKSTRLPRKKKGFATKTQTLFIV